MRIAKWNEIQTKFTEKFGWERGILIMCRTARKHIFTKFIYQLDDREEKRLVDALRKVYREND